MEDEPAGDDLEDDVADGGEDTPEESTSSPSRRSWAHEHPWLTGLLMSLASAALVGAFGWIRNQNEPIPIGRSGTIGSFTYTLTDFACERPRETNDLTGEELDDLADHEVCTATVTVRNNGNTSDGPSPDINLHVGDSRFPGVLRVDDIFPDQSTVVETDFEVPLGSAPTKLRLAANSMSFWDFYLPFYNDWITYDLGSV